MLFLLLSNASAPLVIEKMSDAGVSEGRKEEFPSIPLAV